MKSFSAARLFRVLAVLLALLSSTTAFAAPRDRTPPTAPANLRVTAVSSTSVTLAWNGSTDNSGSFFYVLSSNTGALASASMVDTSYTWTGLNPGQTYTFRMRARDQAMNWSGYSNTVSVTLLPANTVVTPPVLSAPSVGPTHITISWTVPSNAAPPVRYWVYRDGVEIMTWVQQTSLTFYVAPGTTHKYSIRARAGNGQFTEHSNEVKVTTPAADPNDHTPPTVATQLSENDWGDAEFHLSWTESTDDVTPQDYITYYVYVNGELSDIVVGTGARSINYGNFGELNTVEVIAVDEAGNESAPATLTFLLN
ncbi:MAG TPA: fibronectin type III domain-containing protein [Phycisphaerales bacterium]|nr:fibronectin type III domain-containing protein [Phycisphaerales bacterium]